MEALRQPLRPGWRGDGHVTRPEKLNALTFDVYADLRDLLGELPHREDVSVLVITGTGRGFCSGGDVHEIIGELLSADPRSCWISRG